MSQHANHDLFSSDGHIDNDFKQCRCRSQALPLCSVLGSSAMSYSLAAEVASFGVRVSVVTPGAFRTEFLGQDSIRRIAGQGVYRTVDDALARWAANDGRQMGDPTLAAAAIMQMVEADSPPLDLLLGQDALDRVERRTARMIADIQAWRSVSIGTAHR